MNYADKVIGLSEQWLGYLEKKSNYQLESLTANSGDNNYTIFCKWFDDIWKTSFQAQPWCAVFVSVMLYKACGKEVVPHFASCTTGITNFKKGKGGAWVLTNPKRGDLIFFSDKNGNPAHVGLVSSVGKNTVVTIEGNTSSAAGVVDNGGCVRRKSYALNYTRIIGYGRPDYKSLELPENTNQSKVEKGDSDMIIYKTNSDIPEWARATVTKLLEKGFLRGEDGVLNLEHNMLRVLVINDRAGLYK